MPEPTPKYSVIDVGFSLARSSFISVPGNSYVWPSPGALPNKVSGFFPDLVPLNGNANWRAPLISLLENFLLDLGSLQALVSSVPDPWGKVSCPLWELS